MSAKARAPSHEEERSKGKGSGRRSSAPKASVPGGPTSKPKRETAGGRIQPAMAVAAPSPEAVRSPAPFETFVVDLLRARGGNVQPVGPAEYEAAFDPTLARKLRRPGARLVFDPDRATLPRGGVFVAPGSRFGLILLEVARGAGLVARGWLSPRPGVDPQAIADQGLVVHDAEIVGAELGERRWVAQLLLHFTLTLKGGMAEQDLRIVSADPRGPTFEFLELDDWRVRQVEKGFPGEPVWWGETDLGKGMARDEALRLWPHFIEWLNHVQEQRLERWRRRCEEARDRDLSRVNDYYQTRLAEERERRRRRSEASEEEEQATEAEIKLEWGRRVRSVRARWEPQADIRLWGIEEVARPRVPVTWSLETKQGRRTLSGEVDLADGTVPHIPCPVCGRPVGEFWWEGQPVCRRCRGRGGRIQLVPRPKGAAPPTAGGRSGRDNSRRDLRVKGGSAKP